MLSEFFLKVISLNSPVRFHLTTASLNSKCLSVNYCIVLVLSKFILQLCDMFFMFSVGENNFASGI